MTLTMTRHPEERPRPWAGGASKRRAAPSCRASRPALTRGFLSMTAVLFVALSLPAAAQDWPTRPVTVVVPFAAGGPIDLVARIVAPRMSESLGQQVVVENVGGAGGIVGASRVAKAESDGYMALVGNTATHTYSQLLQKKPPYDAVADFVPSGLVVGNTKVLIVRKDLPVTTLQEFVAYAKQNHKSMQYGSAGVGSATHIACVLLNDRLGTEITHVPYRGTGPAMQDLMAGRIDFMCDIVSTALPQIRAGTVKALALLSDARSPVLPDLPAAPEQGLGGVAADGWNGFFFPKGTPDAIVRKLAVATNDALNTPAVKKRIEELGLDIPPPEQRGPDYLAKLVKIELEKWGPPIKASGITVN
jgi:putative tricarboxylic transport membrane protein